MRIASSWPDLCSRPAGGRHLQFEPVLQRRGVGDDLRECLPVSVAHLFHDFGLVSAVGLGQAEPGNAGILVMQSMVADVMRNEGIQEPVQIRTRLRPAHPEVIADFGPVV